MSLRATDLGSLSGRLSGYDINFDFDGVPQDRLDGCSRGQDSDVFEELFIDRVISIEVFDVGQMNGGFYDVVEGAAGGSEDFFDLHERVESFIFDGAADSLSRLWVHWTLAANIDPAIN